MLVLLLRTSSPYKYTLSYNICPPLLLDISDHILTMFQCQWVQLVSVDSGTDAQTQLPGGLPVTPETQLPGGLPAVPETRLPGGLSAGQDSQLPGGPSAVQDTQTRLPGGLTSVPGPGESPS